MHAYKTWYLKGAQRTTSSSQSLTSTIWFLEIKLRLSDFGIKHLSQMSHFANHYFTLLCNFVLIHKMKIGWKITCKIHPSAVKSFDFVKIQSRRSCKQKLQAEATQTLALALFKGKCIQVKYLLIPLFSSLVSLWYSTVSEVLFSRKKETLRGRNCSITLLLLSGFHSLVKHPPAFCISMSHFLSVRPITLSHYKARVTLLSSRKSRIIKVLYFHIHFPPFQPNKFTNCWVVDM